MTSSLNFYKENLTEFVNDTIHLDLNENWSQFIGLLPINAKVLDAGCGTGRDSNHFLNKGFEVVSIDPVKGFQDVAKQQFGIDIIEMKFEEIEWQNTFDAIWANASLLHVSYVNHLEVFTKLYHALKSDGFVYCSYKYGEGHTFKNKRDFYNFTEKTFTKFIKTHKLFDIIKIYKQADRRPDRNNEFWLNCLLKKSKI